MMEEQQYLDWNNSFEILDKAHDQGIFVLIIGPKGTGKTSLVREYAKRKATHLESINFSLRTRESHLCLLYTSPSPRDGLLSRMPSSA